MTVKTTTLKHQRAMQKIQRDGNRVLNAVKRSILRRKAYKIRKLDPDYKPPNHGRRKK